MKYFLKEGFLNGNCLTVIGQTIEENLDNVQELNKGQKIISKKEKPLKKNGHIQILYRNLAEQCAVTKITGKVGELFRRLARTFNNVLDAIERIRTKVQPGEVIVIRYIGTKGAPGMPEMLKPTGVVIGAGMAKKVALITDGRFSEGSHGFVVGHITPEAKERGLIGLIKDGHIITIDITKNRKDVDLTEQETGTRRKEWKRIENTLNPGILKKYRNTVSSASEGCVTI